MDHELAIIGSGAAGMSAAIYAVRTGIDVLHLDAGMGGGVVTTCPSIENYLGFAEIAGAELVEKFREHAARYAELHQGEPAGSIDKTDEGFLIKTHKDEYRVKAVILATGCQHRHLGVPGEGRLMGCGVSYCATCDGFFFREKKVIVVGGGNTAAIEALYLKGIGVDVTLVHRRDVLRAEQVYQDKLENAGIPIEYSTVIREISGDDLVYSVKLENTETGEGSEMEVQGVFIAVGVVPQTDLAISVGVELDRGGYVKTDRMMRTNVKGFYAAGDVVGGVRQIITAAAEGATAALTSTEVLGKTYPF